MDSLKHPAPKGTFNTDAERTCLRCGGTEDNVACKHRMGFNWTCASVDLCSECVGPEERGYLAELRSLEEILEHTARLLEEKSRIATATIKRGLQ